MGRRNRLTPLSCQVMTYSRPQNFPNVSLKYLLPQWAFSLCSSVPGSNSIHQACPEEAVHGWLKETVARRKKAVYLLLENHLVKQTPRLPGQFLLGTVMPTVLDIFVALVSHYAPWPRCALAPTACVVEHFVTSLSRFRFDWLEENCSGLCSAVRETLKVPEIRDIFVANDLTAFVQ